MTFDNLQEICQKHTCNHKCTDCNAYWDAKMSEERYNNDDY